MKTIAKTPRITGIGSLPHHNVDTALEYSFRHGIPFLPQIPIRHPWEYMIPQALEGLPGLQIEADGLASLNLDVWKSQSHILDRKLREAFQENGSFENFEPSASLSSCWQPFLWELQERNIPVAKVQLAGPMTCQWALKLKTSNSASQEALSLDHYPELSSQIFQLVLARSLAMIQRLKASQIQPILFLDEPGLYAMSLSQPRHLLCFQELKLMIQTLRKSGASVGIHCCSDTDWNAVLSLGLDILSIDTSLSLGRALATDHGRALENFIRKGGTLSLGMIPTNRSFSAQPLSAQEIRDGIIHEFQRHWENKPDLIQQTLGQALFTPACGLALQTPSDAELIYDKLVEVYELYFAG